MRGGSGSRVVAERLGCALFRPSNRRRRQANRTLSSFTNCAAVRREVRRSRCTPHKMPRLGRRADRQKKLLQSLVEGKMRNPRAGRRPSAEVAEQAWQSSRYCYHYFLCGRLAGRHPAINMDICLPSGLLPRASSAPGPA